MSSRQRPVAERLDLADGQVLINIEIKPHAHDIRVFPYNAETSDEIARVLEMDADGVISSAPLLPN
jgi:hypothetical protein